MGKNISYDSYPLQDPELGKVVKLDLGGIQVTLGIIVRSDSGSPYRKIYWTQTGEYVLKEEITSFKFPKQDENLGKKVMVKFDEDDRSRFGIIVRSDCDDGIKMIELDDGRLLLDSECNYIVFPYQKIF